MSTPIKKELSSESSTEIVATKKNSVNRVADIDGFLDQRKQFIEKVNAIMVETKDFHVIQGKKSLAKGGAEKIASIFGWIAKFVKDEETYGMLRNDVKGGLVVYMCYLVKPDKEGSHTIGQGRGAAILSKNNGDPNKTIKMAQKSAYIDAVIRASGMSDFFTQDLEDMPREEIAEPRVNVQTNHKLQNENIKPTEKQLKFIEDLARGKGYTMLDIVAMQKKVHRTPTQMIDYLKGCPPKLKEELPTIQQEAVVTVAGMSPEDQALVDSIPF